MSLNIEKLIAALESKIDEAKRDAKLSRDHPAELLHLTRQSTLQDVLIAILEAKE